MNRRKVTLLTVSIGLTLLFFSGSAFAAEKLCIVADEAGLNLAKDLITSLNNESIPLSIFMDHVEDVKNAKYVIVLGGAKAADDINGFIKQVLTTQELEAGKQPGGKVFVKENVFTKGQTIIVFTGPDEASAAAARKNSRKTWWPYIAKWFDLDSSGDPMPY